MKELKNISKVLSEFTELDENTILLIIKTTLYLFVITLIQKVILHIIKRIKNNKKEYNYSQKTYVIMGFIKFLTIMAIWINYIESILTLISLISAAITIALREIIFNFFCGIFIKVKKPFVLEDRIEINGYKGDIINIKTLNFEILEVTKQSTGIIVSLPNSIVFSHPLKNYTKAFKYIWDELTVKLPFETDINSAKKTLYKIVNSNEIIKAIPIKMRNQINNSSLDYRIYYNKYEPVIYTEVVDNHIELQIRYLIHPKKARFVKSNIWTKILESYQNNELNLYKE